MKPRYLPTTLWATLAILAIGGATAYGQTPPEAPPKEPPLTLRLSATKTRWKAGDPIEITVTVQNPRKTPALLLQPGWARRPETRWEVRDAPTNRPVPLRPPTLGCEDSNAVEDTAFVPLAPKGSAQLRPMSLISEDYALASGGKYRIVWHYKNVPLTATDRMESGIGLWSDDENVIATLQQMTVCDLTSDALEITVE